MRTRARVVLVLLVAGGFISACTDPIAQSHVDANAPSADQFHPLLKRDLQTFFTGRHGSSVAVVYELLRPGPTQTGVAYPKYYVWAKARDSAGAADEGAVRVAAIDKTRFEVTHFMSKGDIQANPTAVEQVFPRALVELIRDRAAADR